MNLLKNKFYIEALEFIASGKLESLPLGKHIINGDNLFVNVIEAELKTRAQARLEVHNKYIDIQVPLTGSEVFGVTPRSECKNPVAEFDEAKDIQFFSDPVTDTVSAQKGAIVVFTPDMAHAPFIGEGPLKKAIFKIKVQE